MKLFKFLKTFLLNTCILVVSGFGQSVDINKIIKDELSRVKNLVYVANKQIYHSNDEYSPWKNFPLITYEEIINGC